MPWRSSAEFDTSGGSLEIEYEFDSSDEPEDPYLSCTAGFGANALEAKGTYAALKVGFGVGARFGDLEVSPNPDFYAAGDESFFALLSYEGRPVGNVFLMRHGRRTYSLIISGLYFDDPDEWRALIDPKLAALSAYQP